MAIISVTPDTWTEIAAAASTALTAHVRITEASPSVWIVAAPTAPTGSEPAADAVAELLDEDRPAVAMHRPYGFKLFARPAARGASNRVLIR